MRNSRPPKQVKATPRACQALTVKLLPQFSWQLLFCPPYRVRAVLPTSGDSLSKTSAPGVTLVPREAYLPHRLLA